MSRTKTNGRTPPATRKLHAVQQETSSPAPTTEAGKSLWAALQKNPNSSAAELAAAAGIGKSTAPKLLTQWLTEGTVTKTPGIALGGTRVADRWAICEEKVTEQATEPAAAPPPADATGTPDVNPTDTAEPAGPSHDTATTTDVDVPEMPAASEPDSATEPVAPSLTDSGEKKTRQLKGTLRLPKGALHGLVEDFLRERPGKSFGPSAISNKLQRSSGAVANACARLVEKGVLVRTSDSPKQYAVSDDD